MGSKFFETRLDRNAVLFSAYNFAWDTAEDECYGLFVVQIPPLEVAVAQGCYENFTKTNIYENTSMPTPSPTLSTTQNGNGDDGAAQDGDGDLSTLSIVLIVLGCLVLCGALIVASILYMRRRWSHSTDLVAHEIDIGVTTSALIGGDGMESTTTSAVGYVRMDDTFDEDEAGADPDDALL